MDLAMCSNFVESKWNETLVSLGIFSFKDPIPFADGKVFQVFLRSNAQIGGTKSRGKKITCSSFDLIAFRSEN